MAKSFLNLGKDLDFQESNRSPKISTQKDVL